MKRILTLAIAFGALTYSALAAPSKTSNTTAPQCPQCKMTLATKADKAHPAAVKVKGKTFYCCAACGKHKGAQAKAPATKATAKPTAKKPVAVPDCPKCGMKMVATKSTLKATPVKVNGVTYYCCTICPRH